MKLDIVSVLYGLEPGGAEISTRILAQELQRNGVDVAVVSSRAQAKAQPCGQTLESMERLPYRVILHAGNAILDAMWKRAFLRRWRVRKPDVVLIEDHLSIVGAVAAVEELRRRGQNIGLAVTQMWEVDNEFHYDYRSWLVSTVAIARFNKANSLAKRMDFVNGLTEYLRGRIVDRLGVDPSRCGVYHTIAIKEGPKLEVPRPERPLILAPGRVNPEKGSFFFVDAIAELAKRRRDFDALVLGGGPFADALRKRIAAAGIEDVCSVSGSIPYDQFVRRYAEATVVAAPIMYPCGYTRVVLESLYAGKPVVTFDQGSMPEIIVDGKTGYRIRPHSVEDFARACERFVDDPAAAERMSEDCRQMALDHADVERAARGLLERLQAVCRERAAVA